MKARKLFNFHDLNTDRQFKEVVDAINSGIPEAPIDGTEYVRKDGAWVHSTGGGGGISDAPSDGQIYVRRNGAWEVLSFI